MRKLFSTFTFCLILVHATQLLAQSPGGVTGQALWLKANALSYPSSSNITSANNWTATTGNSAGSLFSPVSSGWPIFKRGIWNFNPVVHFTNNKGIGAAFVNNGSSISTFAVVNYLGNSETDPFSGSNGGVRTLALAGGVIGDVNYSNASYQDNSSVGFLPVLRANPMVAYDGASNLTYTANALSGNAPGIAAAVKSGSTSTSGNTTNTLITQWNGGAIQASVFSRSFDISYYSLGAFATGGGFIADDARLSGYVPEVIIYNTDISSTQRQQINSYLAIKYGITLNQASPYNYLSSDGNPVSNVIWNASANSAYNNNIAGVGRDDASALLQKESQSINSGTAQVAISISSITPNNEDNTGTITSDRQFLVWGDDGGALSLNTLTGKGTYRLNRVWKIQNSNGFSENTKIYFPVSYFNPATPASAGLIYGTSAASLNNGTGKVILQSATVVIGGTSYYEFIVPASEVASNLQYFSFSSLVTAPGGISNIRLWLRADKGTSSSTENTSVTSWTDQSGNGYNVTAPSPAANIPIYRTANSSAGKNFNFNPYIDFTNQRGFYNSANIFTSNADNGAMFVHAIHSGGVPPTGSTLMSFSNGSGLPPEPSYTDQAKFYIVTSSILQWSAGAVNAPISDPTSLPALYSANWTGTLASNKVLQMSSEGKRRITAPPGSYLAWGAAPSNQFTINDAFSGGVGDNSGSFYASEYMVFNNTLSNLDLARVNSYMSVKYGTTLSQDIDGDGNDNTTVLLASPLIKEGDYVASDGTTVIWQANSTYKNNIAGIGRDDISDLLQKQSQSINAGTQIIMSIASVTATNALNTGSFSNDLQFLVWGDNGSAGSTTSSSALYSSRLNRVWKVQSTNNINQNVLVLIPASLMTAKQKPALIYNSSSATFASGNTLITSYSSTTVNGNSYYSFTLPAALVNQANFYVTVAYYTEGPGGVAGESLWLKADAQTYSDGATINTSQKWIATTGNSAGQYATNYSVGGMAPVFKTGAWNFNPVVRFNLGAIGADYSNTGINKYTSFTAINYTGNSGGQNSGEVRTLSFAGGATPDAAAGCMIPILGAFPIRNYQAGSIINYSTSTNSSIDVTSGKAPGIALSMKTPVSGQASGNTASTLNSGWNGYATNPSIANSNTISVDYYVLGGLAKGNKLIDDLSYLQGDIPEVIMYDKDLTVAERQRVNSYLSLKYGITLDQSTAQDYLASDGTTKIWDATANAAYKYNIAGIGQDIVSVFAQKQSQSINSNTEPVIALGSLAATNETNTNSFSGNMSFEIWSSDNGAKTFTQYFPYGNVNQRMVRVWKVQETGNVGVVMVALPAGAVTAGQTNITLISADDAALTANRTLSTMALQTINGQQYYTTTIDFTNNRYFSFGVYQNPATILINPTRTILLRKQ